MSVAETKPFYCRNKALPLWKRNMSNVCKNSVHCRQETGLLWARILSIVETKPILGTQSVECENETCLLCGPAGRKPSVPACVIYRSDSQRPQQREGGTRRDTGGTGKAGGKGREPRMVGEEAVRLRKSSGCFHLNSSRSERGLGQDCAVSVAGVSTPVCWRGGDLVSQDRVSETRLKHRARNTRQKVKGREREREGGRESGWGRRTGERFGVSYGGHRHTRDTQCFHR